MPPPLPRGLRRLGSLHLALLSSLLLASGPLAVSAAPCNAVLSAAQCGALADLSQLTQWAAASTPPDNPCSGSVYGLYCDVTNTNVVKINLANVPYSGTIPASISALTGTPTYHLTRVLLVSLSPLTSARTGLTYLSFYSMHVTGTLPDSIGSLTGLSFLDVGRGGSSIVNPISGTLPASLVRLYCAGQELCARLTPGRRTLRTGLPDPPHHSQCWLHPVLWHNPAFLWQPDRPHAARPAGKPAGRQHSWLPGQPPQHHPLSAGQQPVHGQPVAPALHAGRKRAQHPVLRHLRQQHYGRHPRLPGTLLSPLPPMGPRLP